MTTATQAPYDIGAQVVVNDRGTSREATVYGHEFIDNGRRPTGWWLLVTTLDGDRLELRADQVHFAITEDFDQ